jgi:hypothetical protein
VPALGEIGGGDEWVSRTVSCNGTISVSNGANLLVTFSTTLVNIRGRADIGLPRAAVGGSFSGEFGSNAAW